MPKTRIKLNNKGFNALRNSAGVRGDLASRAHRIASAAGAGYEVFITSGKTRAHAYVSTSTPEAMRDQAENNTLLRAMDAGR